MNPDSSAVTPSPTTPGSATPSSTSTGAALNFEQKLQNYADLIVQVGAGLSPEGPSAGQRVLVQSPVETAALARAVVDAAYRAGASFVDVRWDDDAVVKSRFLNAPEGSFEMISKWRVDAEMEVAEAGGSVIAIRATDPNLLGDADSGRVAAHQRALAKYRRPYSQIQMSNRLNWNLISAPIAAWAELMFPDLSPEQAMTAQWDAIFAATRADLPDPVSAWKVHLALLKTRRELLTGKQYQALHFKGGGTDLTVGLADNHIWGGGSALTLAGPGAGGTEFTANIPTEEVWTAPHRERVDGVVVSTKPLSYNGTLISGIRIEFTGGRVVSASAEQGEGTLKELIDTDEGSHRLGEVALVPHSSPISRSGLFFYNTLYDENAASHIAIGAAYKFNVQGGVDMDSDRFLAAGGNESLTHVDWMIGSNEMDVDGVFKDGSREAVMRGGEFVI
jgi:aminopeptidase